MTEVFVCSNPQCRTVFDEDPRGHCPACVKGNGGGWSAPGLPIRKLSEFRTIVTMCNRQEPTANDGGSEHG